MEIGVDKSLVDYAFHVVLYSEFESQEFLDAYAIHPEHLWEKKALGSQRIGRFQVDYEPI